MKNEAPRHRSTASTARLVSSIILITSFLLLMAGVATLVASISPANTAAATDLMPYYIQPWFDINAVRGLILLGFFVLFAWMGYVLRILTCLLESQIPDEPARSVKTQQ